jgi:uncharacterized protein
MKASMYNQFWSIDNKKVAYNSLTNALAEVDDQFVSVLNNIQEINYEEAQESQKKLLNEMLRGNFIVQDIINEKKIIDFRLNSQKYSNNGLFLTIAPTLECNFKCLYCYENPQSGKMNEATQRSLITWIMKQAENKKNISITWYGGEPLLAKDLVFALSEEIAGICEKNQVKFDVSMVSNGYLIDDEVIEQFKKMKLNSIQVTLDGPPDVHNSRRMLKFGAADTFNRILTNIKKLKQSKIRFTIRINVDKENADRFEELLCILKENGFTDDFIGLGKVVSNTENCHRREKSCMMTEEFTEVHINFIKRLVSNGFNFQSRPYYPGLKGNYCGACHASAFVVDPQGFVYKCWNEIGNVEKAISNVNGQEVSEKMRMNNINYMTWSPFDYEECRDCKYVPICMGGCPYTGMMQGKPACENWKYNLEEYLKITCLIHSKDKKAGAPVNA